MKPSEAIEINRRHLIALDEMNRRDGKIESPIYYEIQAIKEYLDEQYIKENTAWIGIAAIKFPSGNIYSGRRHHICFERAERAGEPRALGSEIQGFLDTKDIFHTREEALEIVRKTGQLKKPLIGSVLTSEDLW